MKIIFVAMLAVLVTLPARAAETIVKTDYLACNPERQFNRAEEIRKSEDAKTLKAFTAGALLSGTCVSLKAGASVFTEGSGKGPGIVKVRPKGAFKTYFTSELAFQSPAQ
jgi:hypothetical protein